VSVIDRTWTATDDCGNQSTGVQRITIRDSAAPSITAPANLVLEYPADTRTNVTGVAVAQDCGPTTVTYSDSVNNALAVPKIISRLWTARDEWGNTTNVVQTITVADTKAPVLQVPASLTLEFPADTTTNATGVATATDASGLLSITHCDAVTNVCGTVQCIKRTWTAVDACGNSASGLQTITVVDSLAPVLVSISESPEGSGNFTLVWEVMVGRTYHFQWRENLLAGEWQNLLAEGQENYTADAANVTIHHAVGAGAPRGFFRALVVTP
jgi:hypothetical protein